MKKKKIDIVNVVLISIIIVLVIGVAYYIISYNMDSGGGSVNTPVYVDTSNGSKEQQNNTTSSSTDISEPKKDGIGLSLTAGNYICGIDFPPGTYDIYASKGAGNVIGTNGLNEMIGIDDSGFYIDNYKGSAFEKDDVLSLTGTLKVSFGSNAAEIENYTGREETGKPIKLETGNYLIGTDIDAGVYNITCTNGSGNIYTDSTTYTLNETMQSEDEFKKNKEMSLGEYYIIKYNNAILEEGTVLSLSGIDIELIKTQPKEQK